MGRELHELSPRTRWLGRRLEVHRTVESTNLLAEQRGDEGAADGTTVIADAQTAGRGRLGRRFFSPAGHGVYVSVLLRPKEEAEGLPGYVFAAALAVAETVRDWLPAARAVTIKWPNDVLVDGRKISGINLPVRSEGGRVRWAVLGVGVNVNVPKGGFPEEISETATSLRIGRGEPVDRVVFAEGLLEALERRIDEFRTAGLGSVLDGWDRFFRMRGARVRVGGPGIARELEGVVEGIGPTGALVLRTALGIEHVLAGDVTILEGGR